MTDTTPAIEAAERAGIAFDVVRTERAHSAEESAQLQGIELAALLRTIVVRRGDDDYVFVLVPGGRRFDWPKVRAHLGSNGCRSPTPTRRARRPVTNEEPSRRSVRSGRGRWSSTPRRQGWSGSPSVAALTASTSTWRRLTWSRRWAPTSPT